MTNQEAIKIVSQTAKSYKRELLAWEGIEISESVKNEAKREIEAMELAVAALQSQEDISCTYNLETVMEQLDGAAITKFEGRLKDGRICHYEDIKYIVRAGGELPK